MKKLIAGISCAAMVLAASVWTAPAATAAEENGANQAVTQAELARLLVRVMGLGSLVSPMARNAEYFDILAQNGVYPKDEWQPNEPVEKGLLARLLVQALRMTDQVEDIDDYQACINALREANIPIDTVGMALAQVRSPARAQTTVLNSIGPQVDPILRRDPRSFNPLDERTGGTDAEGGHGAAALLQPGVAPVTKAEVVRVVRRTVFVTPPAKEPERPVTPIDCYPPVVDPYPNGWYPTGGEGDI